MLAESFSKAGVPVFCSDVKGDLSGIAIAGEEKDFLLKRAETIQFSDYAFDDFPTIFLDLYGEKGQRVRPTTPEMGPLLLARLMDAPDPTERWLNLAYQIPPQA